MRRKREETEKGKGRERGGGSERHCAAVFLFHGKFNFRTGESGRNCDGQGEFGIGLRRNDCALN